MDSPSVRYRSLEGTHVLVCGGGSGIGLATVAALLAQGCFVSVGDIRTDGLEALLRSEQGDRLAISTTDVTDTASVAAWVEGARERFGAPRGLVASAGIEPSDDAAVHEVSDDAWHRILDVNLNGTMRVARAAVTELLTPGSDGGSVVLVGSPTGHFGLELGHHAYSASKAGVTGLGRVMAHEYAQNNVRVNVVWPGMIDTPINDWVGWDPEKLERELQAVPQRRMGSATEIASMIMFLLSDQAEYCTGGIFAVDGGLTAV